MLPSQPQVKYFIKGIQHCSLTFIMEFFCPESVKNFISNLIILSITAATPFLFIQDGIKAIASNQNLSKNV